MNDFVIMWEWFSFAVRWLHVTTAIAWIGSSFYFIALDLGLKKIPTFTCWSSWRRVASPWWWILPYPKIFGCSRKYA
jgi:uncharacterized membrane protein